MKAVRSAVVVLLLFFLPSFLPSIHPSILLNAFSIDHCPKTTWHHFNHLKQLKQHIEDAHYIDVYIRHMNKWDIINIARLDNIFTIEIMAIVTRLVLWFMIHDLYRMNESNNLFVCLFISSSFSFSLVITIHTMVYCIVNTANIVWAIYFAQHKHSTIPTVSSSIIHSQKQSSDVGIFFFDRSTLNHR